MKIKKHYLCILSIFIMMMASAAVSAGVGQFGGGKTDYLE